MLVTNAWCRRPQRRTRVSNGWRRALIGRSSQEVAQVVGQFLRGGVPVGRVPLQGLQDDRLQFHREGSVHVPWRNGLVEGNLPQQFLAVGPVEDRLERQQFIKGRPQRVDVGAVVDHHALGQGLLGRHVTQRPHQVAGHGQMRVALHLGQAEVGDP